MTHLYKMSRCETIVDDDSVLAELKLTNDASSFKGKLLRYNSYWPDH